MNGETTSRMLLAVSVAFAAGACSSEPTSVDDDANAVPTVPGTFATALEVPDQVPTAESMGLHEQDVIYLKFDDVIRAGDRDAWRELGAWELYYFHGAPGVLLRAPKETREALADLAGVIYYSEGGYGELLGDGAPGVMQRNRSDTGSVASHLRPRWTRA